MVMSTIKAQAKKSPAKTAMTDGKTPVMSPVKFAEERERMLDALAILKDALNMYPIKAKDGKTPAPQLFINHGVLLVPFMLGGHVIKSAVMADGKVDFTVDGINIIPVMAEVKK
jgi:hypothetical protein